MNETALRQMVEQMVRELAQKEELHAAPKGEVHAPDPAQTEAQPAAQPAAQTAAQIDGPCLDDITQVDIRGQYLVPDPQKGPEYLALKARTPARIGLGRAGARYKTETMLRFRADHAAAQDSVFSLVDDGYPARHGFFPVQTLCETKDEYLTRPDKGRRFNKENQAVLKEKLPHGARVILAVGDGLSSAAIEANAADCVAAIRSGLEGWHMDVPPIPFIKFCRVGAGDHIGELTQCELICLLVGERPGLVTAESMSAYLTYLPRLGVAESKRTVVSNIHRGGTAAVEAGAHIAELIATILEKKASGVDLVRS